MAGSDICVTVRSDIQLIAADGKYMISLRRYYNIDQFHMLLGIVETKQFI